MRIEHTFDYDAYSLDIADEFCSHDSDYQSDVLNAIGLQFKIWSQDKKRTSTYIQMLEIAEQLDEKGQWFIKTLCEYIDDKSKVEPQECEDKEVENDD